MTPRQEKENVKDAVASSTVSIPPANSVEIENPTRKPGDAICDWCRDSKADIWCDTMPICFDCLEAILERERAVEIVKESSGRTKGILFQSDLPPLWEKNASH